MADKNDELLKRLLATFRVEADEHLQGISSGLLALEKTPAGAEALGIIETVFRDAHSLKGAARAVNLTSVEALCQSLEGVFAALKNEKISVSAPLLDLLLKSVDSLGNLLASDAAALPTPTSVTNALLRQLDQAASGVPPVTGSEVTSTRASAETAAPTPPPSPATMDVAAGSVRISTKKLDSVMRQVEELLSPRLAARQRALELQDTTATVAAWKKTRAHIQPALRQIERSLTRSTPDNSSTQGHKELQKVLEYLEAEQMFIATMDERLAKVNKAAARDQRMLAGMADSLLADVKDMQLLPFDSLLEILPRLARELAREQGKEVELAFEGSEIELDRRMLGELKDPLIHLLRNAIDHGIETPAVRTAAGKSSQGTITVAVSQQDSGKVELLIVDDGAGIDGEKVRAAARKLGHSSGDKDDGFGEQETLAMTFQSGISTSPIITDVSGRGLGLAIVREKVERLGGHVSIESQDGVGTTFKLVLPLSLATFRGVLVRVNERICAIPSVHVERVARLTFECIRTVENRETIVLDGDVVSLVGLGNVLEIPQLAASHEATHIPVVVLDQNETRVAFRVDEILGEQEILVKPLGPQLTRVRNVAGASMLGNGQVVAVLNVADLLKSAVNHETLPLAPAAAEQAGTDASKSILVAEDSITSRLLLKGILESAGYAVTTVIDGMEAYTTLKTATFDLVVSDVEMPRMDGFDLTARVRADKKLADLPVVLVTSLESRDHRERGIDVGANAYIVKSSFDQSNLLEIIRRLV